MRARTEAGQDCAHRHLPLPPPGQPTPLGPAKPAANGWPTGSSASFGSWTFILAQSAVVLAWIALNLLAWAAQWDPYPFILLNLLFSTQAAYAAPLLLLSQNRQAERDRIEAETDFRVNQLALQYSMAWHHDAHGPGCSCVHNLRPDVDAVLADLAAVVVAHEPGSTGAS